MPNLCTKHETRFATGGGCQACLQEMEAQDRLSESRALWSPTEPPKPEAPKEVPIDPGPAARARLVDILNEYYQERATARPQAHEMLAQRFATEIEEATAPTVPPANPGGEALVDAADAYCSMNCPSVKRTGEEWTHTKRCHEIRALLAAIPSNHDPRYVEKLKQQRRELLTDLVQSRKERATLESQVEGLKSRLLDLQKERREAWEALGDLPMDSDTIKDGIARMAPAPVDLKELRERVAAEIFWHFPKDDSLEWKVAKGCDKVKHRECADKILTLVAPVASKWPPTTDRGYREATAAPPPAVIPLEGAAS